MCKIFQRLRSEKNLLFVIVLYVILSIAALSALIIRHETRFIESNNRMTYEILATVMECYKLKRNHTQHNTTRDFDGMHRQRGEEAAYYQ